MRTKKKRTTNKRLDPVFSEKQQKAAVPQGMAAFLRMRRGSLDFKSSRLYKPPALC